MLITVRIFTGALALVLILGLSNCHSGVKASTGPLWTQGPSRTVDSGYIVLVGKGEDSRLERAMFKAESEAIADLANECSFPPKGARIEDHFDEVLDKGQHRAYAKLGITFEECEAAKQAIQPESIRTLANLQMTQQLKEYQKLIEEPDPGLPELATNSGGNSAVPSSASGNHTTVFVAGAPGPYWGSPVQYYVARQQVAYLKQDVILSPAATYAPNAPATQHLVSVVTPATTQIQHYEVANPGVRSAPTTWSHLPDKPAALNPHSAMRAASVSRNAPAAHPPGARSTGRRRRRH